jgi:FtsZ-binding cell division protein ZapB
MAEIDKSLPNEVKTLRTPEEELQGAQQSLRNDDSRWSRSFI